MFLLGGDGNFEPSLRSIAILYLKNLIESELSGYKKADWLSLVRMKSLDEDNPDLLIKSFNEPLIRGVPEQKMHFTIASQQIFSKDYNTSRPSVGLKKSCVL